MEESLHIKLDKDNYNYNRFATHLRYLFQRLQSGVQTNDVPRSVRNT